MQERIIYPMQNGSIAVIIPSDCGISVAEIARKDVPAGVPYRIVTAADIPTDRSNRDLWFADFSSPDGHGIGADAWFAERNGGGQ